MILLAVIASAHGIKGAVKVKTFTQNATNIFSYGPLQDEKGSEFSLKLVREVAPDTLIMKIKGVDDRNQAEALRGTKLYVERSQLPDLPSDEFYHSDLLGLMVQDLEGQTIGSVRALSNFGAGDFLEIVDSSHHIYTIPFTRKAVPIIRLPEKGMNGVVQIDRLFLLDSTTPQSDEDQTQEDRAKENPNKKE